MDTGKKILIHFQNQWRSLVVLEALIYALGPAVLIYLMTENVFTAGASFLVFGCIAILLLQPWAIDINKVSIYLDRKLIAAEYSSGLLLSPADNLSGIAALQRENVLGKVQQQINRVKKDHHLWAAGLTLIFFLLLAIIIFSFNMQRSRIEPKTLPQVEKIGFRPIDSVAAERIAPVLDSQRVLVTYPRYTHIRRFLADVKEIKALEGSQIFWRFHFSQPIDSATLDLFGHSQSMKREAAHYSATAQLHQSGFYSVQFKDTLGNRYASSLFRINMFKDHAPILEPQGLDVYKSFDFDKRKKLRFTVHATDDFGLSEAYVIATVSQGSGENVKFREEKLPFNERFEPGSKNENLSSTIDLDSLKMVPGDELYFYIEAQDLKQPRHNVTRSETYFAVIKDTVTSDFAASGAMGVELMPDYFRSQRQLIIDTEKLIKNRINLSKKEFGSRSNELGAEQKSLRLKYGQFMGDEAESGIHIQEEMPGGDNGNASDPLEGYRHDHDAAGEHDDAGIASVKEENDEKTKDALGSYVHNHDDPEESTLFTLSLKSKLRQALNEMWDAELQLRLVTPEKSLPYQHRALDLLQEIKNSARIYVHRLGFDPPPIKEDKRLTGKLDEVRSNVNTEMWNVLKLIHL